MPITNRTPRAQQEEISYTVKPAYRIKLDESRPGPKDSRCSKIVEELKQSPTGLVEVVAGTPEQLSRLHKSIVQWRIRHLDDEPIGVKKTGDKIYVWIPLEGEDVHTNGAIPDRFGKDAQEPPPEPQVSQNGRTQAKAGSMTVSAS